MCTLQPVEAPKSFATEHDQLAADPLRWATLVLRMMTAAAVDQW